MQRPSSLSPVIALVFVGAGLVLLAGVALFFLFVNPTDTIKGNNSAGQPSAIPMVVDFPAPDLQLTDLAGQPVSLEEYRGLVVLVNNWATWCPPCKAEMPTLQAFYEDHRQSGFSIIAVEAGEPVEQVAEFTRQMGLTFPVWPDPDQKLYDVFHNISLPTSWLINRDGQVVLTWTGAIDRQVLEQYVTPLLEE